MSNLACYKYPSDHYYNKPKSPSYRGTVLIAVLVFILLAVLGFGAYATYISIYNSGRISMQADIETQMAQFGYRFCKINPSDPQAIYPTFPSTVPTPKEDLLSILSTLNSTE